ncbi:MAG: TonB-dependent receptor [Woeseiaceae bacterium]|nr:TonB-dependent receptor [Woeseiaceae bacterium]
MAESANDLFDLSIEELVNLEITTVSRKAERLADATSAVFVITRDDIARHGIRSIPDALRLAPGLHVAQIDANKWAIGSRGLNGRYANKLLVLMDGRLLYTPSFSGVFWDVQSTLIEEIERIEIIRGPGAVAWGTNAVNGVVNIITRSSSEANGGAVVGGLDPQGGSFFAARYEGRMTDEATYRTFVKYQSAEGNQLLDGSDAADDWDLLRASFRADWLIDNKEFKLTVEGYSGEMGTTQQTFSPVPPTYLARSEDDSEVTGAFVMGHWTVSHNENAHTNGQAYVDYTDRSSFLFGEQRTTYSLDVQHHRTMGRHEIVAGGWLRFNNYDLAGSGVVQFLDTIEDDTVISVFIQDEITLVEDELDLILGLKLEDNELSPNDIEVMPTVRMLWKPIDDHALWASVTRAVRTPSIADLTAIANDIVPPVPPGDPLNPTPLPARVASIGNPDFQSESNLAYELGARGQISGNISYDLAWFTMDYEDIRSFSQGDAFCQPSGVSFSADPFCVLTSDSVLATLIFSNVNEATISGVEATLDWMVRKDLRLRTTLSYADEDLKEQPDTLTVGGTYPEWQFSLRSEWSPTDNVDVAALVRYVDELNFHNLQEYWQANAHLRWRIEDSWVLSMGVRNLMDDVTAEYKSEMGDVVPVAIERTAFINLRYSF